MADKVQTEISSDVLEAVRRLAREEGREESEVLEDAVRFFLVSRIYFARLYPLRDVDIVAAADWRTDSLKELFERVAQWQKERGVEPLSDDAAMNLANEELHAYRRERPGR